MSELLDDDGLLDLRNRGPKTDPAAVVRERRAMDDELPAANDALASWQAQERAQEQDAQTEGQCLVCRKRSARSQCKACGKAVCASCSWVMFGMCRQCATDDRMRRWHGEGTAEDINWLEQ